MMTATNMVLNDLLDVSATPGTAGALLVWDGTEWVANEGTLVDDTTIFTSTIEATEFVITNTGLGGIIETYGPNGSFNTYMGPVDGDEDNGIVAVGDESGFIAGEMASSSGAGTTILYDPDGDANVYAGPYASATAGGVIAADSTNTERSSIFALDGLGGAAVTYGLNSQNTVASGFGTDIESGGIFLFDGQNRENVMLGATAPGISNAGFLELFGTNGNMNLSTVSPDERGALVLGDTAGDTRVAMRVLSTGDGYIETVGPANSQNVLISALGNDRNAGFVIASDSTARFSSSAGIFGDLGGTGQVEVTGPNGFANFSGGSDYGGTNPNKGSATIWDSVGSPRAGMFIDGNNRGIIWGTVKNFRTPHPNNPNKEIWYASLEGPEAAAYVRGTATLVNGEVTVAFPEHFEAIASPQSMTVVLTPLSAESEGLAVIEKTAQGFKVKELRKGTGSYSFDWEVKCVRKGFENYRVVRDADEMKPRVSAQEKRALLNEARNSAPSRQKTNSESFKPVNVSPAGSKVLPSERKQISPSHR